MSFAYPMIKSKTTGQMVPDLRKVTLHPIVKALKTAKQSEREEILAELVRITTPGKRGRSGGAAYDPAILQSVIDDGFKSGSFLRNDKPTNLLNGIVGDYRSAFRRANPDQPDRAIISAKTVSEACRAGLINCPVRLFKVEV
jgi:hypothetical protein